MKLDVKDLKRRQKELEYLITRTEARMGKAPDGRLRIDYSHNSCLCYVVGENDPNGKKVSSDSPEARALAQKSYDARVLKDAGKEKELIDRLLEFEAVEPVGRVFDSMSRGRRELVRPYELTSASNREKWEAKEYRQMGIKEGQFCWKTRRGDFVRSRAEMDIADTLLAMDVPYRYEYPWKTAGATFAPDFTVLNVRTEEVLLWEHFGMLDNGKYLKDFQDKMEMYAQYSLYPGHGLLVTFEDREHPLNIKLIEKMVKDNLK